MNISISLIFAQIINIFLLFFVFKILLANHLNKTIIERRRLLKRLESVDAEYEKVMREAEEKKEKLIKQAKKEAKILMQDAEILSKRKSQDILDKANFRVKMILEGGQKDLEKEKRKMLEWLKEHIIETAILLNKKVFSRPNVSKEFLEKELESL